MKDAAIGFGTGVWLRHRCSKIELPHVRCAIDEDRSFRLTANVLAASITNINEPGRLKRQKPRVEATLGRDTKLTGFATYSRKETAESSASGIPCPWRFDDTLMLSCKPIDVLGAGLKLQLRAYNDVRLGPFELEFAGATELGECFVDLRRRVLPACVKPREFDPDGSGNGQDDPFGCRRIWESPVLVVPIAPPGCGGRTSNFDASVGHITISFGVSIHPEIILQEADAIERPLGARIGGPLRELVGQPVKWASNLVAMVGVGLCTKVESAKTSHIDSSLPESVLDGRTSAELAIEDDPGRSREKDADDTPCCGKKEFDDMTSFGRKAFPDACA